LSEKKSAQSVVPVEGFIAILNENEMEVAGAPPPSLVLGNFYSHIYAENPRQFRALLKRGRRGTAPVYGSQ